MNADKKVGVLTSCICLALLKRYAAVVRARKQYPCAALFKLVLGCRGKGEIEHAFVHSAGKSLGSAVRAAVAGVKNNERV